MGKGAPESRQGEWLHSCRKNAPAKRVTFEIDGKPYHGLVCSVCGFVEGMTPPRAKEIEMERARLTRGQGLEAGSREWWAKQVRLGMQEAERSFAIGLIARAIAEAGNVPDASRLLGCERTYIYQKLRRLGMNLDDLKEMAAEYAVSGERPMNRSWPVRPRSQLKSRWGPRSRPKK